MRYEQMLLTLLILLPLTAIEVTWFWRQRRSYPWREVGASTLVNIGQRLIALATGALIFAVATSVFDHRITTISMDRPIHWIALFFAVEFAYYWFHRWSHEVRWLWTSHSVHHSANNMNFPAATRLGWTGLLTGAWAFWLPIMWLGFPPTHVLGMLAGNLIYQFWLHTEMIPRLHPAFEWLFNSPSHHRVHHGANVAYLDANYGGVIMIFDRLFGTFVAEKDDVVIRYGLVKPETSLNPFVIALGEMRRTIIDVWTAPTAKAAFMYLFGPPGYSHDGSRETTAMLKGAPAVALTRRIPVWRNMIATAATLTLLIGIAVLRSS